CSEMSYLGNLLKLCIYCLKTIMYRKPRAIYQTKGTSQQLPCLKGKFVPLQPHKIQSCQAIGTARSNSVGRHIMCYTAHSPNHSILADARELMHSCQPSDDSK